MQNPVIVETQFVVANGNTQLQLNLAALIDRHCHIPIKAMHRTAAEHLALLQSQISAVKHIFKTDILVVAAHCNSITNSATFGETSKLKMNLNNFVIF